MLHASEYAAAAGTPVFGVRMGRLGFLSEVTSDEAATSVARVLEGAGRLERRSTVRAQVNGEAPNYALNDAVIGRASLGRTISVGARVDGVLLAEYRADAVIIATATGSTGYSLSVGGPILPPESEEIILVPVAPHLTNANALVLPTSSEVSLYVERGYEAMFTVDGMRERAIDSGSTVTIGHGDRHVDFVRLGGPAQFYANVAERLGWLRSDHVLGPARGLIRLLPHYTPGTAVDRGDRGGCDATDASRRVPAGSELHHHSRLVATPRGADRLDLAGVLPPHRPRARARQV